MYQTNINLEGTMCIKQTLIEGTMCIKLTNISLEGTMCIKQTLMCIRRYYVYQTNINSEGTMCIKLTNISLEGTMYVSKTGNSCLCPAKLRRRIIMDFNVSK